MRPACAVLVLAVLFTACGVDEPDDMVAFDEAALIGPPGSVETTLIPARSAWQYEANGSDLGTTWRTVGPGASWPTGNGPLGYGEPYVVTTVPYGDSASWKHITTYFRRGFDVADRTKVKKLYLRVMYDDGLVFYINTKEGGRAYMPSGTITYTTLATNHETGNAYATYDISSQIPRLLDGHNSFAIEVHQMARGSSDMVMDVELIAFVESAEPPRDVTTRGIPSESTWSYWDQGGDLGTAWRQPGYVETGWRSGQAPLGYGEPYVNTTTQRGPITQYFRKQFTSNGDATGLYLEALFDDGFVAYLNGEEILRAFMPAGPIDASTLAQGHETGTYVRFMLTESAHLIREGVNTLAIEVHNVAASSSDLVWDARLVQETAWRPLASSTTEDLQDVEAIGDNRAYVVGDAGTILRTRDDGATWTVESSGTTADLSAIEILDDQAEGEFHGVVVGNAGTILHVDDDFGVTWTDHSLDEPADLRAVSCAWPTCVAVARGDGDVTTADLYVSTDNGLTWAPRATGINGGSWEAVYFQTPQIGWIAGTTFDDEGGTIWGTTDGGATWTRQWAFEHHGYWPMAMAPQHQAGVWMVGESSFSGHGEVKLVTRDGVTWDEAPRASEQGLFDIVFEGAGNGYAVGFHGEIVVTRDGGETWQEQRAAHHYVHATLLGIDYDSFGGDLLYAVGTGGTILQTRTGGEERGWARGPMFDDDLRDVEFDTERHGWILGDDDLYETVDGGDTWTSHPQAIGGRTLEVLDRHHLWIGDHDTVWASTDGGATFTGYTVDVDVEIADLEFISPTVGWAVVGNDFTNDGPDRYRTLDGGVTWHVAPTGANQGEWFGIAFSSATTGWLAGDALGRAIILISTNGGDQWLAAWPAPGSPPRDYGFTAAAAAGDTMCTVGASVGVWGEVKVCTRDGGVTWFEHVREDGHALTDVFLLDANRGWAVGVWGATQSTDDAGRTWDIQVETRLDRDHLSAVHFSDAQNGWAVGANGVTFETSTGGD
jgi:photosystem II stability/assembly factor-like uncharacterized protein